MLIPVEVSYEVRRIVFVDASTEPEARKLARDVDNWADAGGIGHECVDDVRVPRDRILNDAA